MMEKRGVIEPGITPDYPEVSAGICEKPSVYGPGVRTARGEVADFIPEHDDHVLRQLDRIIARRDEPPYMRLV